MNASIDIIGPDHYRYKGYDILIDACCTCSNEGGGTPHTEYSLNIQDTYEYTSDLHDCIRVIDEIIRLKSLPIGTRLSDRFVIGEIVGDSFVNSLDIPHYSKIIPISHFMVEDLKRPLYLNNDFKLKTHYHRFNKNSTHIYTHSSLLKTHSYRIDHDTHENGETLSITVMEYKNGKMTQCMDVNRIEDAILVINNWRN